MNADYQAIFSNNKATIYPRIRDAKRVYNPQPPKSPGLGPSVGLLGQGLLSPITFRVFLGPLEPPSSQTTVGGVPPIGVPVLVPYIANEIGHGPVAPDNNNNNINNKITK